MHDSIFLTNIRSFHLDFLDIFKDIKYKGIPLPLICNFRKYIGRPMINKLSSKVFEEFQINKIVKSTEVQPNFEKHLNALKVNPSKHKDKGKILLYEFVLYLPKENFLEYFDSSNSIVLSLYSYKNPLGHSLNNYKTFCLAEYCADTSGISNSFIAKCKQILSSFNNHPVFSDPFFQENFLNDIPQTLKYLDAVIRFFEQNPISCILVGAQGDQSDHLCNILPVVGLTKGIPSIGLQHGLIWGGEWVPIYTTIQGVYGNYEKEFFKLRGVSEERLKIIGHPRFDSILTKTFMSKTVFQQMLGLDSQKRTLLIATQPDIEETVLDRFICQLSQNPLLQIIIKPHPHEIAFGTIQGFIDRIYSKYPSIKVIKDPSLNIYDILSNADMVVIDRSTAGLEAMIMNKPVFVLRSKNWDVLRYDYWDLMNGFVQLDPIILSNLVNQLTADVTLLNKMNGKIRQFLSYHYPLKEQLSIEKLSDLIYKLTGQKIGNKVGKKYNNKLLQSSKGEVYLIENGIKRKITSDLIFKNAAYKNKEIIRVEDTFLEKIPTGRLI
ncbi:MAG TPA: hypothetical protein VNM69_05535 [Bacillus sp. (in: firmicutes)]|uniref:capsular polysaccharide export protein, LipB/KpsS family n=1 Tax=Bacillus litorisediminis TaxID=2922713 RepID=UPI001FAF5139|nr:hypothetical protein [Bacillus litorisediminis]HWO75369.1 hypothetical protein [Bacillus sp. (in: firmicutes)]